MAYRDATMEWVDGNLGSRLTMKYPSVYMMEPGAGEILSIAFAGAGQHLDAGAKLVHCAPNTTGEDHFQVDLEKRRPQQLSWSGACGEGGQEHQVAKLSVTR